jgi:SAM-dependent methyltransferase
MASWPVLTELETVPCCPVCGDEAGRELFLATDVQFQLPGRFPLVRCRRCRLAYLRERPTPRALKAYYPQDAYYAYRHPARHHLFERTDRAARAWYWVKRSLLARAYGYRHLAASDGPQWVARLLLPLRSKATFGLDVLLHPWVEDGAILEVGCGAGMYLDLMRALGWRQAVGVDLSETAVRRAREELGLEAYCGELAELGLGASRFDAVTLSHTLEHVGDPVGFLAEVRRLMKPGGRLAVVVPNMAGLGARLHGPYWHGLDAPRHLVNFSPHSLGLAMERAGLRVERLRTSPRVAYEVALHSHGRRMGDHSSVYTDPHHRFPLPRRARARVTALVERAACALGAPAGEELMAVARRASGP